MNEEPTGTNVNRREFLIRSVKAGLAIACVGGIAGVTYTPTSTHLIESKNKTDDFQFLNYSIPGLLPKMCIATGSERSKTIQIAFKSLGGIETFIKPKDHVLLKVNAAFASPPSLSATTHPDLVMEVARLCYQAGASKVIITDNPINDPVSCFMLTGIEQAARAVGAEIKLPHPKAFKNISVKNATLIQHWPVLVEPFQNIHKVIGIAPIKDHHRSGASMSMKNWYGLLGGRRNIFHQHIHTIIKELAMMITPTLVILDGTTTMMRNGPTGGSISDLKQTNTIIVSTDQVAADAFGATLLDKSLHDLPFITMAQDSGVGTADFESIHPIRV